jgi:heme/copper-type cytochrome/quinol oxidase subunit 4
VLALAFGTFVVLAVVVGSLWIMTDLHGSAAPAAGVSAHMHHH